MGRPGGADRWVPCLSRLDSDLIARCVEPAGDCGAQRRGGVGAVGAAGQPGLAARGVVVVEAAGIRRPRPGHTTSPALSEHRSRADDRTGRHRAVHLPVARWAPVLARRRDDRAQRARSLVCRAHRFALARSERAIRVAGPASARRCSTLGTGELAARLVPLLFGIATLAVALWIGRRWMGPAGATALMLLCSISPWFSHYPFEVKHYTSDVFWALLLPALAVWAVEADAVAADASHGHLVAGGRGRTLAVEWRGAGRAGVRAVSVRRQVAQGGPRRRIRGGAPGMSLARILRRSLPVVREGHPQQSVPP